MFGVCWPSVARALIPRSVEGVTCSERALRMPYSAPVQSHAQSLAHPPSIAAIPRGVPRRAILSEHPHERSHEDGHHEGGDTQARHSVRHRHSRPRRSHPSPTDRGRQRSNHPTKPQCRRWRGRRQSRGAQRARVRGARAPRAQVLAPELPTARLGVTVRPNHHTGRTRNRLDCGIDRQGEAPREAGVGANVEAGSGGKRGRGSPWPMRVRLDCDASCAC